MKLDPFTVKRLTRLVEESRRKSGQLPTLADFEAAGFPKAIVDAAVRERILEQFYVTLQNGSIVKGFKIPQ